MRYLIVRIAAIGDVAMATPLLNRIRTEDTEAHVSWLCGTSVRELVALFPGVDTVIAVDERRLLAGTAIEKALAVASTWRQLAGHRFDRVLMLHPDVRYRLLTLPMFGAQLHAASHGPGPDTNPVPGRFRGDEAARLLDGGAERGPIARRFPLATLRDRLPKGPLAEANGIRRVAVVPGGARNVLRSDVRRRWPVASYRALIQELLSDGIEPVLIGDAGDAALAAEAGDARAVNLVGRTSLIETLAVLRDVDVLVTHDTGPMHLARLVGTPIVALFGPTNPHEFVGLDDRVTTIWGGEELPCRPCYDGRDYPPCAAHICMSSIPVQRVLEAVQNCLRRG